MKNNHTAPDRRWILLVLFAVVVALTGGASRFDASQIVPLRALSATLLLAPLFFLNRETFRTERTLLVLFGCFALILLLQLAPLPPWLWGSLVQRVDVVQLDAALGLEEIWRPSTLTPLRTWNVLGSLAVPAAALLLAVTLRASSMVLLRIVAGLGVLNGVFGLLQIATGESSIFYLYELTNKGSPVGILANENHSAILAACSMLVVTSLGLRARQGANIRWERLVYAVAFFIILFVSLVGGSRAGFLAAIGATLVSSAMLVLSPRIRGRVRSGDTVLRWLDERPRLILITPFVVVLLTAASFLALDRAPAFRDLLGQDSLGDLRWSLWPVIGEALEDHWLVGSGFGSFEQVFHIYEPSALLMPFYVNQAHNDWAQLVIEGGVFAGLLMLGLLAWLTKGVGIMSARRTSRVKALFWISVFGIVAAASVIDYPLRTPLFQVVIVWLLLAFSRDARSIEAARGPQ